MDGATPHGLAGGLIACPECDALHDHTPLNSGERARCRRCGALLYRRPLLSADQLLALDLAALFTLAIANSFPIVLLDMSGNGSAATLFGSVLSLWTEGREIVALLVFSTAFLFPLVDLLALLVLLSSRRGWLPRRWLPLLSRFVAALRPWGMTEVFMLGIVVSLVKLAGLARIVPGPALWAFAAATVLLAIITSYDQRSLWHALDAGEDA